MRLRLSPRRGRLTANLAAAGLAAAGLTAFAVAAAAQQSAPAPAASAAGAIVPRAPGPGSPVAGRQVPSGRGSAGRASGSPGRAGGPPGQGSGLAAALPASAATAVDIPAIGVHSGLQRLGLNPDGSVQVPVSYQEAGWYDRSASPGTAGPAVLLGHVDSRSGPGVFFRLGALRPGDRVLVRRADGRTETYIVTGVRQYDKDHFPTLAVYGPTSVPTIRLITCGGAFDPGTGHYLDNTIAFGQLAGSP